MVWVWIVFAASMFGLGISVILDLGKKKTLALFSLMLLMGAVFFFPVPQDLLPIVGVAWYGLLMFILWLFVKHFKLDKRSAGNGSVVELQETKQ
jgi:4-hydroxybenzoate polyprenyltransferase